ncbi:DUF1580 domain-containing protein [Botrimarina mediterranea]|uniref:DUF1580 domain-containing protein n=1 Tax=Botrimarina mediterranea TaxID=2528022 RepID=A0A518KC51_9BACT|nr:DUF1580 domain-containing protein [Botrimarina mediterranea]QDV75376.1 hypothetical protein Spa11_35930 [Botrimarina mediterranea]
MLKDNSGYLTLPAASATLPGRPHVATLHRWRTRGVRGVRLRTCLIGGRRYTTREWLREFIEATTAEDAGAPRASDSPRRESEIAAAERCLKAAGI